MKQKKVFPKTTAPHWRAPHTASARIWHLAVGLVPILIAGFIFDFVDVLRLLLASVAFGFFCDYAFAKLNRQKFEWDVHTAFLCILFIFLIPAKVSLWVVAVGIFFTVVVGKKCFGKWGGAIFQSALIGRASILVLFPNEVTNVFRNFDSNLFHQSGSLYQWLIGPTSPALGELSVLAILIGGTYLIYRSLISWKIPVFFVMAVWVFSYLPSGGSLPLFFSGAILFPAFFLMTDSTSPVTSTGRILFAVSTAFLVVIFRNSLSYCESITYAILLMNAVTPLMDRYLQIPFQKNDA